MESESVLGLALTVMVVALATRIDKRGEDELTIYLAGLCLLAWVGAIANIFHHEEIGPRWAQVYLWAFAWPFLASAVALLIAGIIVEKARIVNAKEQAGVIFGCVIFAHYFISIGFMLLYSIDFMRNIMSVMPTLTTATLNAQVFEAMFVCCALGASMFFLALYTFFVGVRPPFKTESTPST